MPKLSDRDLLATIEREERNAYGYLSGELATERTQALDYYLGREFGNEVEGRSKVVSTDVADTIEWVMPSLLKIFASGDKVVMFNPRGPEDVEAAEQETDYVNFVVMEKNAGLEVLYTWFKDALLSKVGYVKAYFEEIEDTDEEYYEGLGDDELAMLLQDGEVEPIEHEAVPSMGPDGMPVISHNVKVKRIAKLRRVKIEAIPPEEVLLTTKHRTVTLQDADFIQHRTRRTISDLRAQGFDIDDDIASDDGEDTMLNDESISRDLYDEFTADMEGDRELRKIMVRETYIRIDRDGDGIAELRRILTIGDTILEDDPCDLIPFAALTPILMPHRHVGRSYADLVMDLQLIKSTVLRQILDNMYLANNGRTAVNANRVNLDDLLVSRPGGVIRVDGDPGGAMMPIQHPMLGATSFSMVEYIDTLRENRTGVTKYNQGLDSNSLNKTASGVSQIMTASQQRIELVARLFAETGVKDLFLIVHALCRKHSQKAEVIRLRGQWVPIDPRQWKKRSDLSIAVGLGTGNKDQQLQHLMTILTAQREAIQLGIATPKNIYNALVKLTQNAGFKDPDEFWTSPDQQQQQQPQQPDPEQVKAQAEQMKMQMDMQDKEKQRQFDAAMEQMKDATERYKAELQAQTDLQIAQMRERTAAETEIFKVRNASAYQDGVNG